MILFVFQSYETSIETTDSSIIEGNLTNSEILAKLKYSLAKSDGYSSLKNSIYKKQTILSKKSIFDPNSILTKIMQNDYLDTTKVKDFPIVHIYPKYSKLAFYKISVFDIYDYISLYNNGYLITADFSELPIYLKIGLDNDIKINNEISLVQLATLSTERNIDNIFSEYINHKNNNYLFISMIILLTVFAYYFFNLDFTSSHDINNKFRLFK